VPVFFTGWFWLVERVVVGVRGELDVVPLCGMSSLYLRGVLQRSPVGGGEGWLGDAPRPEVTGTDDVGFHCVDGRSGLQAEPREHA